MLNRSQMSVRSYLAHSLLDAGFEVFAEVPVAKGKEAKKVDLVAFDPRRRTCLVCELKRDGGLKESKDADFDKIMSFRFPRENIHSSFDSHAEWKVFGLIAGTTWCEDYMTGWTTDKASEGKMKWLDDLQEEVKQAAAGKPEPTWGSVVLQDWSFREQERVAGNEKWQYLLFLLFERAEPALFE